MEWEWRDVAAKVGEWAPAIGAALAPVTGGSSLLIGGAVGAITKALGLSPNAKPEEVLNSLNMDPEARLKAQIAENEFLLKKREQEIGFQLKQREQTIDELKSRLADVQSARGRQTEGEKATGSRDVNLYFLAWLMVFVFFTLTGMLLYFSYNGKAVTDSTGVLFMLLGSLSAAFGGVIQYFFGSSAGSAAKSATIESLVDKKGN